MAKELVSDKLWEMVEPILPAQVRSPKGGRPPISNRAALAGINGLWQWNDLLEKTERLAAGRYLGEDSACDPATPA